MPKSKPPVTAAEVSQVVLRALLQFEGRPMSRDTIVQGLSLAATEINFAELRAVSEAHKGKK